MIKLIILKELKDIIISSKFAATFGICSILILLSFYVGARNYQIGIEQYEAAKRENLRKMEGITDWSDVRSVRISLPPQPLASLVMGISNDIGRNGEVRGTGEVEAEDSRYGDDPIYAVFRFLDLDFIFQIALSLFAILFAYDAINGEKERGTLRLTFANSVPRGTYILGKIAGSFLALVVPLLVPMLIGALILITMKIPLSASDWGRLGVVITGGFLYLGAFLAISLFVSSRTERSSISFLLSLIIWIFSVMIIPRTAVLLAGRAIEVPSVDEINSKKSRYRMSLWGEDRKKMVDFRVPTGTPSDKMFPEFQKFMSGLTQERDQKMSELAKRLNEERMNKQWVQQQWAFGLARTSPTATLSFLNTSIVGTGIQLQDDYRRSAGRYQQSFGEFMKEKTGVTPSGGFVMRFTTEDEPKKTPINPMELPQYDFIQPPLSAVLGGIMIDVGILALFNILFFAGAFISFLRFDVR
jgi:ABC-type transport system involved in multi-copper enzyme maturation permease subunit